MQLSLAIYWLAFCAYHLARLAMHFVRAGTTSLYN